jgi:pimeloyl-ACP methyl ester carboxylesterase
MAQLNPLSTLLSRVWHSRLAREDPQMTTANVETGWDIRTAGSPDAAHTVLLLPGGMCTAAFFEDVLAAPRLSGPSVRLVAVTLPGFGDTQAPDDVSVEKHVRVAGDLATHLGCDVVVGHSYGANVALEMVASGTFAGPVVLLSPTFSRADEGKELRILDGVGRVPGIGKLAWFLAMKAMPGSLGKYLPPARRDALVMEFKKNRAGFCRRLVRSYFSYLDRHGSLVDRLCQSGERAFVVRGDHDEVGLMEGERRALESCRNITMVVVPDAGHMVLIDQPAHTVEVILRATQCAEARRPRTLSQQKT